MRPPLIGLRFYDHSMNDVTRLHPIICDTVGWLYAEDKLHYHIATWICDSNPSSEDTEVFHILKSTVIQKFVLKAKSVQKFEFRRRRAIKKPLPSGV